MNRNYRLMVARKVGVAVYKVPLTDEELEHKFATIVDHYAEEHNNNPDKLKQLVKVEMKATHKLRTKLTEQKLAYVDAKYELAIKYNELADNYMTLVERLTKEQS